MVTKRGALWDIVVLDHFVAEITNLDVERAVKGAFRRYRGSNAKNSHRFISRI